MMITCDPRKPRCAPNSCYIVEIVESHDNMLELNTKAR